jgi:hypothetical protein
MAGTALLQSDDASSGRLLLKNAFPGVTHRGPGFGEDLATVHDASQKR